MAFDVGALFATIELKDDKFKEAINRVFKLTGNVGKNFADLGSASDKAFEKISKAPLKFNDSLSGMKGRLDELTTKWESVSVGSKRFDVLGKAVQDTQKKIDSLTNKSFTELDDQIKKSSSSFDKLKNMLKSNIGQLGIGLGVGAGIASIIKTGADFKAQMSQVQAVTNATEEDFKSLNQEARRLGATTSFSATEAAQAMTELGKAGMSSEEILQGTNATLNLAKAGSLGLAEATAIASDTMSGFKLQATDMSHISDVLAKTANMSTISVGEVGETFKYVAGVAATAGGSLEQVAAMTALLGKAGIKGSMAGTTLKQVFLDLSAPTSAAAKQLEQLGIATQDAEGNLLQVPDVLSNLANKLQGVGSAKKLNILKDIFGVEPAAGVAALLDKSIQDVKTGVSELDTAIESVNVDGFAEKVGNIKANNLAGDFKNLQSALEELQLIIFDALDPALRTLTQIFTFFARNAASVLTPIKDGFLLVTTTVGNLYNMIATALNPIFNSLSGVIAPLAGPMADFVKYISAAGFAVGGLVAIKVGLAAIGTVITSTVIPAIVKMGIAFMANPVGLVIAAIAAGFAIVMTTLDYMGEHWTKFRNELDVINDSIDGLIQVFSDLWNNIVSAFTPEPVNEFLDPINAVNNSMNQFGEKIDWVGTTFKVLGNIITVVIASVSTFIQFLITYLSGVVQILWNIGKVIWGIFTFDSATIMAGLNGIYDAFVGMLGKLWAIGKKWASDLWKLIKGAFSGDLVMTFDVNAKGGESSKEDDKKDGGFGGKKPPPPPASPKPSKESFESDKKLVEEWYKQNPIVAEMTTDLKYQSLDRVKKDLTAFVQNMSKQGVKLDFGLRDIKKLKNVEDAEGLIRSIIGQVPGIKDFEGAIKHVFDGFKPKTISEMRQRQSALNEEMNKGKKSADGIKKEITDLQKQYEKAKDKTEKISIELDINLLKNDLKNIDKEVPKEKSIQIKIIEAEKTQDEIRRIMKEADAIIKDSMSTKMFIEAKVKLNNAEIEKKVNELRLIGIDTANAIEFKTKLNDAQIQLEVNKIRMQGLDIELNIKTSKDKAQAEINNIINKIQVKTIDVEIELDKSKAKWDSMKKSMELETGKNSFVSLMTDVNKEFDEYAIRMRELDRGDFSDIWDAALKKVATTINFISRQLEIVINSFQKLNKAKEQLEKTKFNNLKQDLNNINTILDKMAEDSLSKIDAEINALEEANTYEKELEESKLSAMAKADDDYKKGREEAEAIHQAKLEQIKRDFELKAQLAKDEFAQQEKARLDELMKAEMDKLQLEYENKILYIEENTATDEEEQLNKELTLEDHEARKSEIQQGYKDMLAENIQNKNTEIDDTEKNRKMDFDEWEKMFEDTKLQEQSYKNLSIEKYEKLRADKLKAEELKREKDKEAFQISIEKKREQREQRIEQAQKRRDQQEKQIEKDKQDRKRITALIEYMAGFSVFQAEQRGKISAIQMNFAMLLMNSIAGVAASFAQGGLVGIILGMVMAGLVTTLGAAAMATSMSMVQSQKYPPFMGFAEGGQVPGSGGVDSVPAMLTPGEIVMPEKSFRDIQGGLQPANNQVNVTKYYLIENGRESEINENEFDRRVDSRINYVIRNAR